MSKQFNVNETAAGAGNSRAMEADTILKTRASLKSRMSKGDFLIIVCIAFLSSFFMLSGCKKDKNNDTPNDGQVYLLSEIDYNDGWMKKFEYNDENRITKIIEYEEGEQYRVFTLNYDSDGDLTSILRSFPNYAVDYESTFLKSENIITVTQLWNSNISTKIELNAQGLPSKIMEEETFDNGNWYKESTTFKYQGKNIIEFTEEWSGLWNGETETGSDKFTITYDNKKAPFYYCKTSEWFLIFFDIYGIQNNMKTAKCDHFTGTFEYTYNNVGFPLTRTSVFTEEDGNEQTDTGFETYKYVNSAGEEYTVAQNKTSNPSNIGATPQKRGMDRNNKHTFGNMFGNRPNRK